MDRQKILEIGLAKIGHKYEKGFNCETFVRSIYREAGYELFYYEQPYVNLKNLLEGEFIGNILFLKHKKHGQEKRFTHVGIIFPDESLLHYSRYFGEPGVREVFLTPFEKIFEVYDLANIEQRIKANGV